MFFPFIDYGWIERSDFEKMCFAFQNEAASLFCVAYGEFFQELLCNGS